jgi:hypothetical protein
MAARLRRLFALLLALICRMSSRLGKHMSSPAKPRDKRRNNTIVRPTGQETRRKHLLKMIEDLKAPNIQTSGNANADDLSDGIFPEIPMDVDDSTPPPPDLQIVEGPILKPKPSQPAKTPRRILPDDTAFRLYTAWKTVLPELLQPYLRYKTLSTGSVVQPSANIRSKCAASDCEFKTSNVTCIYYDRESSSW